MIDSTDGFIYHASLLKDDDSIPVRANKKKGLRSKKELREEVRLCLTASVESRITDVCM